MKLVKIALALVVASACAPMASTSDTGPGPAVVVTPSELPAGVSWGPAPASLPAGARAAVLDGDPTREGIFTMRLWFPANYRINPHSHPAYEHVTLISGVLHVGMGQTFSPAGWTEMRAGDFKVIGPNMAHFAHTPVATVLQLHGMGPWQISYVNAADDPRNR